MLDIDPNREGPTPKGAATIAILRDAFQRNGRHEIEIFCVERNKKSGFLGGAIVFPGGRLEDSDADPSWLALTTSPSPRTGEALRAHAIAGCRETLEEAALLLVDKDVADEDVLALRTLQNEDATALRTFLVEHEMKLDLARMHILSRWVTPKVEGRRYDARFFLASAPSGQSGAHDMTETMASFWATPRELIERFDRRELQLAPPTHRTVMQLLGCASVEAALAMADAACLDPVCPELVQQGDTMALVLPGDPQHSIREVRVPGPSRHVLRDGYWRAENAP